MTTNQSLQLDRINICSLITSKFIGYVGRSIGLIIICLLCACSEDTLFKQRKASETGVYFNNVIEPFMNDTFNILSHEYMYNGAGVATGDFNNDGLQDLYFAGNLVSGKLFLNQGNLKFKDVSATSNTTTKRWCTGVSTVDINQDGWLDIYVCVAGPPFDGIDQSNYFFLNQGLNEDGIPVFRDMAEDFGLADKGYSTMAAFFDYDKDNDLDVYLLTNNLEEYNRNILRGKLTNGEAYSNDRLFRNNGDNTFTNVSKEAGIQIEGWGLGICIIDINQDSWPDIYIANDFVSNDLIWVNQKDGTFRNEANAYLEHQTHNGMGVDIADFNNDMLLDIVVLDMLPKDNYREKMMISNGDYDLLVKAREMNYQDQYMRNTLQLNQGKFPDGSIHFSEIAYLSDVFRTDWSWAPLFADFNNDGLKDLYIANGYRKDITNLDFILYNKTSLSDVYFGTEEAKREKVNSVMKKGLDKLDEVKLSNYMYQNNGDITFDDVTKEWGVDIPSFSNGAIYVDLDNDGDLDIVTNNIDEDAFLLENRLYQLKSPTENHYLRVNLSATDHQLIYGTKLWISIGGARQYLEYNPFRGYKSTVEPYMHFGTGQQSLIDTMMVIWPDNKVSQMININADQLINIDHGSGKSWDEDQFPGQSQITEIGTFSSNKYLFQDVSNSLDLSKIIHSEKFYDDFKDTPMLPHLLSMNGPYVGVGDLNGDLLDDVVFGGDTQVPTKIMFQSTNGSFFEYKLPGDSIFEDRKIQLFDFENDGDLDIYVSSGGSQWNKGSSNYQDRIYLNNGKGQFNLTNDILPEMYVSSNVAIMNDIDNDGDLDIFSGGFLVPREYPYPPQSFLLINENGKYLDKTQELGSKLKDIGIITDATWADINSDGANDLVIVGEWMPISIFLNRNGHLVDATNDYGLTKTNGWYHSVLVEDLNKDGKPEIIAGNTGLNSYYKVSEEEPVEIFTKDFDLTGSKDPILTHYNDGKRYISFYRNRLINQINGTRARFTKFDKFAKTTFDDSFTTEEMENAHHLECNNLTSIILQNMGGSFTQMNLPMEAQFAPIKCILSEDINQDGKQDLILVGNSNAEEPIRGDYDASFGLFLLGKNGLNFQPIKPYISGFVVEGFPQQITRITIKGIPYLLITRNNDSPLIYAIK